MSYNSSFSWSPYFDHVGDQNGRNQPSDMGGPYQRPSYQSTTNSAISNAPAYEYPPAQSTVGRTPNSYSRYTPAETTNSSSESARAGPQGHFDSRRLPPYSGTQSSTNTTTMGSLAYAPSLTQERRNSNTPTRYDPIQHIVDYNRNSQPISSSAGSAAHAMTSTASNGYEHHHSNSQGPGIAREEYKPSDSQNTPSTSNANISSNNEPYSRPYARPSSRGNPETLPSRFIPGSHQTESHRSPHPKRPTSGQGTRASQSKPITTKFSRPADPRPPQASTQNSSAVYKASNQRQAFQAAPVENYHVTQNQPQSASTEQSSNSRPRQRNPPPYQPRKVQRQEDLPPTADSRNIDHSADQSRETETSNQTTVDPSQIFNHYEYQRRQATAEATRKAAEEAAAKKTEATKPAHVAAPATAPATAPAIAPASAPSSAAVEGESAASRKGQMELEMMQMLEKMRDYKAKDPALFSQIWEQVKKGQPANRSSSQAPVSASNGQENVASEVHENEQLPSPNPTFLQLPLESEPSVKPLEGKAPDLGKFPFQRRRPSRKSMMVDDLEARLANLTKGPRNTSPFIASSMQAAIEPRVTNLTDNIPRNASSIIASSTQAAVEPRVTNLTDDIPKNSSPMIASSTKIAVESHPMPKGRTSPEIVHVRGVGPEKPQNRTPNQTTPKGGTIWPERNKWALAEAARRVLTSNRVNIGRAIYVDEIVNMLDQNPSYIELCELLELRGFIIDRGHFARSLLLAASGSDITTNEQQRSNADTQARINDFNGSMGWHEQRDLEPPNMNATRNQPYSGFGMLVRPPIRSHGLPSASEVISRSSTHRNKQKSVSHGHPPAPAPSIPPSLPPSKKEMAKKRTFGEIVDLTQEISDEDDSYQRAQRARLTDADHISETSIKPPNGHHATDRETETQHQNPLREIAEKGSNSEVNSTPLIDEGNIDLLQSETIVRPMNKRNDALRCNSYNAKTIARDILVTSGKHPIMTPLNHHLELLRKRFRHVDNNSDLTTLRWDLIDPGGPAPEAADDDLNDADDEGAAYETSLLPQQTQIPSAAIGDDVFTTVADISIQRPIKGLPALRTWKPSRLSRTHAQSPLVQDPINELQQPISPHIANTIFLGLSSSGIGSKSGDEGEMSFQRTLPTVNRLDGIQTPPSRPRGRPPGSGKNRQTEHIEANNPSQPSEPRRRGRPVGSKNSAPRKSAKPEDSQAGTPTGPQPSIGSLRQGGLQNAWTPPGGVAVVIDPRPPTVKPQAQDKKGRLESFRRRVSHKVYKCRWNDCPYELHNLQTLRKHVHKHREQYAKGPFPCCWADCGTINLSREETDDEPEDELIPLEFDTASAWETHMDAKHLDILAWDLGDGPSAPPSDAEASDYLSDVQGRQMTPVARNTGPPDPLVLTSGRGTAKEYHNVHGNKTNRDKAQAVLEALKEKKTAQGLGTTWTGTTAATKETANNATAQPGYKAVVPPKEP